jgi:hypothetical protein
MSIICISGFYLEGPSLGSFECFDLTNPRGKFGGERFHLACPKLGLGDEILLHTILVWIYISAGGFYTSHKHRKRRGAHHWWFPARGAHCCLREACSKGLEGHQQILAPGFSLHGLGR